MSLQDKVTGRKEIWEPVTTVTSLEVFQFTGILMLIKKLTSTQEIRTNWETEKMDLFMKEFHSI